MLCAHSGEGLTKHKVVWPEDLAKRARADRVHGARFQVNQHGSGNIISTCGDGRWKMAGVRARPSRLQDISCPFLPAHTPTTEGVHLASRPTCGLIVVDVDSFQLEVTVPMIGPGGVNAVFVADYFPELERRV